MPIEMLVLSVAMAAAAGLVGCFAVMRRMALAADALSHVALPGIGVALALNLHPLVGAVAMLMLGAVLVWAFDDPSRAATETLIGVLFSTALAAGSLMTSDHELVEALFGGGARPLGVGELAFGLLAAALIVGFIIAERNSLIIALVSPDLARTAGIDVRRLDLLFMLVFALTIALGLRYLGVLLMGALVIIPGATAKRTAGNLSSMLVLAVAVAVAATLGGSALAAWLDRETGPLIVTVAAGLFVASLWYRRADA